MLGQTSFRNMCLLPQEITFKVGNKEATRRTRMNMVNNKCYLKYKNEWLSVNDLMDNNRITNIETIEQ